MTVPNVTRKLAAILATDVAGTAAYSRTRTFECRLSSVDFRFPNS